MRVLSSVHLYTCPCRGTIFLFSFLWVPGVDVAVSASVSIHMCLPGLCIYYQRPPWKGALFILCKRWSVRLLRWLWSPPKPRSFPISLHFQPWCKTVATARTPLLLSRVPSSLSPLLSFSLPLSLFSNSFCSPPSLLRCSLW